MPLNALAAVLDQGPQIYNSLATTFVSWLPVILSICALLTLLSFIYFLYNCSLLLSGNRTLNAYDMKEYKRVKRMGKA